MMDKSRKRQEERRFERERARSSFVRKARRIMQSHAGSDTSFIDKRQFDACKEKVISVCEQEIMDLRTKDLDSMFDLVDYENSGIIEIEELLYGMVQLSSEIRPMSIMELRRNFARSQHSLGQQVSLLDSRMQMMDARLQEILAF